MTAKITFFPVANGDMTLLELESGRRVLIDCRIREAADDPEDDTPDVAGELRARLTRDDEGHLYVDAFLLSHPDADHCSGLRKHFHLGPADEYSEDDDKIFIRELWSSPIVFRRAKNTITLTRDAEAFWKEARRRVKAYRDNDGSVAEGDRVFILGEDENGKTDDVAEIVIKVNEIFNRINTEADDSVSAYLLGPLPKSDDETGEEALAKNRSSTILQFTITADGETAACQYLTGGDAEVAIWERLWQDHSSDPSPLAYDLLLAPHHCSWHSLSYDSWSEQGKDANIAPDARRALGQAKDEATIVASSDPIKDDDNDPPCIRAKQEYEEITENVSGLFLCTGEEPSEEQPAPLEFTIGRTGPVRKFKRAATVGIGAGIIGRNPLPHGAEAPQES